MDAQGTARAGGGGGKGSMAAGGYLYQNALHARAVAMAEYSRLFRLVAGGKLRHRLFRAWLVCKLVPLPFLDVSDKRGYRFLWSGMDSHPRARQWQQERA